MNAGAAVYDLRGLNCPLPVLRARKRLDGMAEASLLWVETTDPLAVIDIPAFCADGGHELVETQTVSGGHRFLIRRGPASPGALRGRVSRENPPR